MEPMRHIPAKIIRRLWKSVFQPAARYPVDPRAVFILVLSVFSALIALAVDAAPATLQAVLPQWAVITWGIMLALGSVITLGGMAFQSLNGILFEQVGSVIVGAVTLFYSSVAFLIIGDDALQPVGIILAWGISCFVRWIQLQALIVTSYRTAAKRDHERQVLKNIQQAVEDLTS